MIYFYSKTNEINQFLKFILFCSSTLHVSDGLSVHHQGSKLYIQHQVYVIEVLWLLVSKHSAESVWHIPDAVCTVLDPWWWTERPSETCRVPLQNKFEKLVHLVGFTIELYFLLVVNLFLCASYLSFLNYLFFVIPTAIIACSYFISFRQIWHSVLCLAALVTGAVSGRVALFLFSSISICRLL